MANNNKNTRQIKLNKTQINRLLVLLLIVAVCFFILLGRFFIIQVFDLSERNEAQIFQTVAESSVSAQRGDIYDANGNVLAKDSASKTVCVIPLEVPLEMEESTAKNLSDNLGLNYVETLKKVTALEDQNTEINRNVSEKKFEAIMNAVNDKDGLEIINTTLYCKPIKIKNADATAAVIAAQLDMTQESVKEILTRKDNSPIEIKHKVEYDIADKILQSNTTKDEDGIISTNGIELQTDSRRLYTNDQFAEFVLGFTDDNHVGLSGIEYSQNDVLAGEKGVAYTQYDAVGNPIPSQTKIVKKSKKGQDVILSIDSNVQSIIESALNKSLEDWDASSGTAIVMETKTGKILGMAVAPGYSLNKPKTISDLFKKRRGQALEGKNETEQLNEQWKNLAIALNYEPGSTFKAITVSAALEEGAVSPEDKVFCDGGITINGVRVGCEHYHGWQTVREAVANSCNAGLVQIIQKLDPSDFYRYVYNFGYGKQTGIELPGEETGIVNNVVDENGYMNILDYSIMSFGQAIATTPIQNLSALNAVVNNGYYMKPSVLSDKNMGLSVNGDLGVSKQIISAETSKEMRQIMEKVVTKSAWFESFTGGCSIGGKTGTAEKFVDGAYMENSYITSFFGYAPVDDPKYSVIVTMDDAKNGANASASSAPVAIDILRQLMTGNLGESPDYNADLTTNFGSIVIPDVMEQSSATAERILQEKGIKYELDLDESGGDTVIAQSIAAKTKYEKDDVLKLTIGKSDKDNGGKIRVPDLEGLSIQFANELVSELGFKLKASGSGYVKQQSPKAGERLAKGSEISIKCEN